MDLPAIHSNHLTVEGEYVVKMRLEPTKVSPAAYHAVLGLESFVNESSKLEVSLLDLVKMRASPINECAFSIDMHSKDVRVNGETFRQRCLAESVNAHHTFVRKSLSKLSKAGLVVTKRGKSGASVLARSPRRITVLDIYRASAAPPAFATH